MLVLLDFFFRRWKNQEIPLIDQKQYSQNTVEQIYWGVSVNFFKPLSIYSNRVSVSVYLFTKIEYLNKIDYWIEYWLFK